MSITTEKLAETLREDNTPWEYDTKRNGKPLYNTLQKELYFQYEERLSECLSSEDASDFRDWCLHNCCEDESEIRAWSDEECIANVGMEEYSDTMWYLAGEVASGIEGYWYENDIPNPYEEE